MRLARMLGLSGGAPKAGSRSHSRAVHDLTALCHGLLSERGEVSGVLLATQAQQAYESFEVPQRQAFFDVLVKEFSPDPDAVGRSGEAYRADPSAANLAELQRVVEPPRQELFRRLNTAPGGTRTLVDMRRDLLAETRAHPAWKAIAADLEHLLASWFNRGFLSLQRIDWTTPANILEKLIQFEAVHAIQGWSDLQRRLQADRRCYGFFHPALPGEPIIFIEVALTRGMSAQVQPLVDPLSPISDPGEADTAIFYSITNCQAGLRGVPFGSFLIKRVAEDLAAEFPRLRKFATLSPIPGFRSWLKHVSGDPKVADVLAKLEGGAWRGDKEDDKEDDKENDKENDKELAEALGHELEPLCAYYLTHAKQGREPLDPVARFHLRNGARLERINWLGDTSALGIERSAGLMVNYVYRLDDVERNHELYSKQYKVIASHHIDWLAKRCVLAALE
ncbi:MAG: malonyl-CoA decarboxylase [Acidobacteriota bacterium]|nr:malonyl-CoA decarboxylase [Acidobacteriota bacterium]